MRTSSAKAKGRRAVVEVKEALLKYGNLFPDDILQSTTSVCGEDLMLSPAARKKFPYSFEVKNVEKINVWEAIKQAEDNCRGHEPVVVFRRNNTKLRVIIDFEHFLKLVTNLNLERGD